MRIKDLKNKKVAIWGAGKEGLATLKILHETLPHLNITILNDSLLSTKVLENLNKIKPSISIITEDEVIQSLNQFDVIIKSPGISIYLPEIKAAKDHGVFFTSSTQLWFEEHKYEKIICITGTKGKSTTTSLIVHMLKALKFKVAMGGNIGKPIIEQINLQPAPDFWVLEMSSYQASDFKGAVSVGVLLNLYPEHLDWHGDEKTYYQDKVHPFLQIKDGVTVLNKLDENTKKLKVNWKNPVYFNATNGFHIKGNGIWYKTRRLIDTKDIKLLGAHNLSNMCAALTAVKALGIDPLKTVKPLSTFQGLPHRLTMLGEKNGIEFVDDSISTIPQATIAAIKSFPDRQITLLLGGFDRKVNMDVLIQYLFKNPVDAVITMYESGQRIAKSIKQTGKQLNFKHYEVETLEQAVKVSKKITPIGGCVLLSPASPSYGAFKNFEERGEIFKKLCFFSAK